MGQNTNKTDSDTKTEYDFRLLAESIPDIIARFNKDLKLVYINHLIDRPKLQKEDFKNTDLQISPKIIIDKCIPAIKETFKTGEHFELNISVKFGNNEKYFESRIIPEKNSINEFETVLCITRDITEWKKAENKLIQSEEKYRRIFEYSPIGIFYFNKDLIITNFNEQFVEILKSSRDLLHNFNINTLKHQTFIPTLKKVLKGETVYYEGPYITKTSDILFYGQFEAAPIYDHNKNIIGGIVTVKDITDKVKAQEELQNSEGKYRLLQCFIGYVWATSALQSRYAYLFYWHGATANRIQHD